MSINVSQNFTTIRTEGGLLPPDLLGKIFNKQIEGANPESYGLEANDRINEAINRSWNILVGDWSGFQKASKQIGEEDRGTTLTREKWLLLLFHELGFGRLAPAKNIQIDGKTYPISHLWNSTPIHLVGFKIDLDRRTASVAGAATASPHSLVQEFLNRSSEHRWAFLSNGLRLRILRDNSSLTRQAYVEFDLEAMMEGEMYADFVMLWLLCHESRVRAERPENCWLEKWCQQAKEEGTRALDHLRDGVENAIKALGTGFLAQPSNVTLREKLRDGKLDKQDYYRQILRLVYRIIFLLVAEERDLLFKPETAASIKQTYFSYYSVRRLKNLCVKMRGTKHIDFYEGLKLVMNKLGSDEGCPELGLTALGSFLWSTEAINAIYDCKIENSSLLQAIKSLTFRVNDRLFRAIDYRNLGAEELGSIYEALLELHPVLNLEAASFDLNVAAGHERKTTGSYYTHPSLVQCLLDSALNPVLDEAAKKKTPEEAILSLKICDPACGSGHFLIAAAHRVAKRLAAIRTGDAEPSPEATRKALRDVISHCIYGVDINPMSVELCKVSLWMEAMEPGKPLSFLENKIQCGNSLLGTTPALLKKGIPDEAFEPIEGDDKEFCKRLRKRNKDERQGQGTLFDVQLKPWDQLGNLATAMAAIDDAPEETTVDVKAKQKRYEEFIRSSGYLYGRLLADAWCASFVWRKIEDENAPCPVTESVFRSIEKNPHTISKAQQEEIVRLAKEYQFFHWHLAFPDVFQVMFSESKTTNGSRGWKGGFDVVLSNPPWDRVKIEERAWFERRAPHISGAANANQRRKLIDRLLTEQPELMQEFRKALRFASGIAAVLSAPDLFPLGAAGDLNTFSVFADLCSVIIDSRGMTGIIAPTSLITDYTYRGFFSYMMNNNLLRRVIDFSNKKGLFPAVDSNQKFCLLTLGAGQTPPRFSFGLVEPERSREPENAIMITLDDIKLVNPNTETCPAFQSTRDAALIKRLYQNVPILKHEERDQSNEWDLDMWTMFHMANDSSYFIDAEKEQTSVRDSDPLLRLYEGKMIQQFDHRFSHAGKPSKNLGVRGTADHLSDKEKADPDCFAATRYLVPLSEVQKRAHDYKWFIGYREIGGVVANIRTMVASVVPLVAVGNKILLFGVKTLRSLAAGLLANLNSFIFDYILRQKMSGISLSFYIVKQIPALCPASYSQQLPWAESESLEKWTTVRVLELAYTAWDLEYFARDCRWNGPPFYWNKERRFLLCCELDATFFHLYLGAEDDWCKGPQDLVRAFSTPRHAVEYIMETFPIVKRKDEKEYGEYRTKRVILEIYDEMAEAIRTGKPYKTRLDPPPADPRVAHPPKSSVKANLKK
jgi:hypothetical protein